QARAFGTRGVAAHVVRLAERSRRVTRRCAPTVQADPAPALRVARACTAEGDQPHALSFEALLFIAGPAIAARRTEHAVRAATGGAYAGAAIVVLVAEAHHPPAHAMRRRVRVPDENLAAVIATETDAARRLTRRAVDRLNPRAGIAEALSAVRRSAVCVDG